MLSRLDHENIEEWADKYGFLAVTGLLFTLLILGKLTHFKLASPLDGKICNLLIVPPAVFAGLYGLVCYVALGFIDPEAQDKLSTGLAQCRVNLPGFIFTALILGQSCSRTSSRHQTAKSIFISILHEGAPMIICGQIIIWGQSALTCIVCGIIRWFDPSVPALLAGLVPLGLEAGLDVLPTKVYGTWWAPEVVDQAENLGMILSLTMGSAMISFWYHAGTEGWLGRSASTTQLYAADREHFQRFGVKGPTSATVPAAAVAVDEEGVVQRPQSNVASLGTHMSMIAGTVFVAFCIELGFRIFETQVEFFRNHRVLSGIRLFKLAMVCALVLMRVTLRYSKLQFKREWFYRLCGLTLDIILIASVSISTLHGLEAGSPASIWLVVFLVLVCAAWNVFVFVFVCQRIFPNFWYERGVVLVGDALGHSYVGLLLARTLDPNMQTPVPIAYAYKLMLFFIPSSGGKNTIVMSLIDSAGVWTTAIVCISVIGFWAAIYARYFREKFESVQKDDPNTNVIMELMTRNASGTFTRSQSSQDIRHSQAELAQESQLLLEEDNLIPLEPQHPTPRVQSESSILNRAQLSELASFVPESAGMRNWVLKYQMARDGASLSTLLHKLEASAEAGIHEHRHSYSSCVILIEDTWGYVFGGYIDGPLRKSTSYYGNGKSFVFRFRPRFEIFRWSGKNELLVLSNDDILAMGGGGRGFAFQIDDELDTGVSNASETFGNPQLSSSEFYHCLNFEVWTFEEVSLLL